MAEYSFACLATIAVCWLNIWTDTLRCLHLIHTRILVNVTTGMCYTTLQPTQSSTHKNYTLSFLSYRFFKLIVVTSCCLKKIIVFRNSRESSMFVLRSLDCLMCYFFSCLCMTCRIHQTLQLMLELDDSLFGLCFWALFLAIVSVVWLWKNVKTGIGPEELIVVVVCFP